jgi:hypothetical protein
VLTYSTELEELAYHKDAKAMEKAADGLILAEELIGAGNLQKCFFERGQKLRGEVLWFRSHRDDTTVLMFKGPLRQALKKIRALPDRSHQDTLNAR